MIFAEEEQGPDLDLVQGLGLLCCPWCQGAHLHHGSTLVLQRREEDGPGRQVEAHPGGSVSVLEVPADAFAGRRDDLRIRFTCEGCEGEAWLFIMQHKGQTFIRWRRSRS